MKPFGNFKKKIMNIGEAPGEVEDRVGKPFQGKTGRLLQETYKKLGIDLFEDCINLNACYCRPTDGEGNNIAPTNYQIESCRRTTLQYIKQYKPKVIVLLGNSAVYSLIGHRWKKELGGIMKWRGWTIPDQDFQAWICPTFHPSFVERSETPDVSTIWVQDLQRALKLVEVPFTLNIEPVVETIEDLSVLTNPNLGTGGIMAMPQVAIDYETTGLKPHAKGHRVICVSVADSENHAYVFMLPPTKLARQPFIDLLANPKIYKIAQNMKFEEAWSTVRLRQPVQGWAWDTMLATHVLDNRPGICGLKFQVYVQFGIVDYSSEIEPYLKSVGENSGNALNRIEELIKTAGGRQKLLKYCGLDAVYEYRLAMKQRLDILPF